MTNIHMTDVHLTVLIFLRWIHILSGIFWVGISFFMNFILSPAFRRVEGSAKAGVMLPLLERAAFWLRWSALLAYVTGWSYLMYKCYGESNVGFHGENGLGNTSWGQWISIGVILGTVMVVHVWFVIWPAQKKIIGLLRADTLSPQVALLAAKAERMGRINAFLSAPLIFTMGAASHLPILNAWIVAAMFVVGFALIAHLFMIANRIFDPR